MSLADSIEDHRAMYRAELDFNPSQRTPPVAYTYDSTERAMVPDDRPLVYFVDGRYVEVPDSATQSTQVGMPMSGRMYRYVAGPTLETPWATALGELRAWCRRNHRYHMTPKHWRGSLCWQLVFLTVIGKPLGDGPATIQDAAAILQYDNPEPILREAFDFIEKRIDDARKKAEKRAREDRGLFLLCQCGHDWPHHDNPATTFACAACDCRRYNAKQAA